MMLLYTLIIGIVLFPQAHSLTCFECPQGSQTCPQKQCSAEADQCGALRLINHHGNSKVADIWYKSCMPSQECIRGSINIGIAKTVLITECCSSNLCNNNNAPEPPDAKPNGKKCHRCDESGGCSGILDCEGDEDHCVIGSVTLKENTATVKGCITRSVCSSGNASIPGLGTISCCEGNYCNGAGGAGVSLLLPATMLISNLFFSN